MRRSISSWLRQLFAHGYDCTSHACSDSALAPSAHPTSPLRSTWLAPVHAKIGKYACLVIFALPSASVQAAPDPPFPEEITISGQEMQKLGDYRYVYRFFFDLYDAALFAPQAQDGADVLQATTSFHLQFRYLREIEKSIILQSADRMLERNLSAEQLTQIAERVDRINQAYTTVRKGDQSSLTYQPGTGTTLRINGKPGVTIEGEDFARLYFRIWLGPQPISNSLKASLLGRP